MIPPKMSSLMTTVQRNNHMLLKKNTSLRCHFCKVPISLKKTSGVSKKHVIEIDAASLTPQHTHWKLIARNTMKVFFRKRTSIEDMSPKDPAFEVSFLKFQHIPVLGTSITCFEICCIFISQCAVHPSKSIKSNNQSFKKQKLQIHKDDFPSNTSWPTCFGIFHHNWPT